MIVTLTALKRLLGIALDDATEDDALTALIEQAGAWVEKYTKRRFDTPQLRTEYVRGSGSRELYLSGHFDDSAPSDSSADGPSLQVARRDYFSLSADDWEVLLEGSEYERRGDVLVGYWSHWLEYRLTYDDGYVTAPDDIQKLVLEIASRQYMSDAANADGTAGVTSEKLGDYSYTVDLGAVSASSSGISLSDTSRATLAAWRRVLV